MMVTENIGGSVNQWSTVKFYRSTNKFTGASLKCFNHFTGVMDLPDLNLSKACPLKFVNVFHQIYLEFCRYSSYNMKMRM